MPALSFLLQNGAFTTTNLSIPMTVSWKDNGASTVRTTTTPTVSFTYSSSNATVPYFIQWVGQVSVVNTTTTLWTIDEVILDSTAGNVHAEITIQDLDGGSGNYPQLLQNDTLTVTVTISISENTLVYNDGGGGA